jgi:hypothetical protein
VRFAIGRNKGRVAAVELLKRLGAQSIPHVNTDLLTHLEGTERILRSWGADEHLCLAGLCHAAYGTDGFPIALVPLPERSVLVSAVGPVAEAIVYRYASCDRQHLYPQLGAAELSFRDRFTGGEILAGPDVLRPFADLTIANEYEIYVSCPTMDAATLQYLSGLITSLAVHASGAAKTAVRSVREVAGM